MLIGHSLGGAAVLGVALTLDSIKIERITRQITLVGDLTDEQRRRLLEIADKCPVHRTLENDPEMVTELT